MLSVLMTTQSEGHAEKIKNEKKRDESVGGLEKEGKGKNGDNWLLKGKTKEKKARNVKTEVNVKDRSDESRYDEGEGIKRGVSKISSNSIFFFFISLHFPFCLGYHPQLPTKSPLSPPPSLFCSFM